MGQLTALPRLLIAGLRGPISKGNGKGMEKGRRKEGKGREGKGDRPLFANSWIRPCCSLRDKIENMRVKIATRT